MEQLQVWGQRNNIPVIAQHTGADSASVIFDAIQAAKARHVDVLIADTAGRLQNKSHLMEELKKIVRVMKKLDVDAPHEVMLTIDASTGQNAVSRAKLFHEAVGLTGITLTVGRHRQRRRDLLGGRSVRHSDSLYWRRRAY